MSDFINFQLHENWLGSGSMASTHSRAWMRFSPSTIRKMTQWFVKMFRLRQRPTSMRLCGTGLQVLIHDVGEIVQTKCPLCGSEGTPFALGRALEARHPYRWESCFSYPYKGEDVYRQWAAVHAGWCDKSKGEYMPDDDGFFELVRNEPLGWGLLECHSSRMAAYEGAKCNLLGRKTSTRWVWFAKSLAIEGKDHGIHVNTVATSEYTPAAAKLIQSDQVMEAMKAYMPATDVAPGVLWLAHKDFQATDHSFSVAGRLVTDVFLVETHGFMGTEDLDRGLESIRDYWYEAIDKTDYTISTDAAAFGPLLFQRLSAGRSGLRGDELQKGFEKSWFRESLKSITCPCK
ncbi:hypothetical protein ACJZ2D_008639 [Fusarium nematophilum]